jgi:hypothetical protein
MAVARNGIAWLGCSVQLGAGGTGGGLIRLDSNTGTYSIMQYENGWPFPGRYVSPWTVTPDGKVWMTYVNTHQSFDGGLCSYDPATGTVVNFPGPDPSGSPQWGGLPHTQIYDIEVKTLATGYELWMSCPSRGIAVLRVTTPSACDSIDFNNDTSFFDPTDIDAFLSVFSEGPCIPATSTCNDIDFNNDGSLFDPCDIDSFLLVFSEGPCTLCGQ